MCHVYMWYIQWGLVVVLAGLKGSGSGWCVCARGLLESGVGVGDGHRLMHRLKHRIVKNWKTSHR